MGFGIDDGPGIIINCLFVISFKQEINTLSSGLYIYTKPQEYAQKIPERVCKSLDLLGASRIILKMLERIDKGTVKNSYRFIPNLYEN